MTNKKKKRNSIFVGFVIFVGSIVALWQNEHRFDYHKAASETVVFERVESLEEDDLFSHSGSMDQSLVIEGEFVQTFTGYLQVHRRAEIYAWDRDEDDDRVTWSKRWMSRLENNSRNADLRQEFNARKFQPESYNIGNLQIDSSEIQLVDKAEYISPRNLQLTEKGNNTQLTIQGKYFYHFKNSGHNNTLGNERLSFSSFPVPEKATYFGKWNGNNAVKHQAKPKGGII